MSDVPFYRTQMGHRFYEATAPSLVHELARLNDNLERLVALVARDTKADDQPPTDAKPEEPR
jgi:hypothetical protein